MNIKRFIYNRLFNERQRKVIWQALLYSEHVYKRRGNAAAVAQVRQVINETMGTAATKQRVFLESEVSQIVRDTLDAGKEKIITAYREGRASGIKDMLDEIKSTLSKSGFVCVEKFTIDSNDGDEADKNTSEPAKEENVESQSEVGEKTEVEEEKTA